MTSAPAKPTLGRRREATALREKVFVETYLSNGHNAREAALASGLSGSKINDTAWKFLKRPRVAAAIAARAERVSDAAEMTTANWAQELSAIAFSDVGELFDEAGKLRPVLELPRHARASLSSIRVSPDGGAIEYKFWSKTAALETIAKHLGLFELDNAQKVPDVRVNVVLVG